MTIRVVVADDHPSFRAGLRAAIDDTADLELVGEAADGAEVVALVHREQPDVVIMDLHMPGADGVAATRTLLEQAPHVAVLVLTMFDDDDSVALAMRAGARGYLVKGARRAEIVRAIESVADGGVVFGPAIARRVSQFFSEGVASGEAPANQAAFPELSEREREVLDLMASGCNNAVIAQRLSISPKTVRNHASSIFTKLVVADRSQAIIRARDAGLGRNP